jgi:hypothetical protein
MSDLRTAAQQALEALEEATNYTGCEAWSPSMTDECLAAATALKAALEQPEQEPVAWLKEWNSVGNARTGMRRVDLTPESETWLANMFPTITPLYTHPPRREWRGLTEEEINAVFPSHLRGDYKDLIPYSFARAIEAALKEKNT